MSLTWRTILIVDDSPEDRELYRRYLLRDQDYSYTFLEASLGQQGLELWQQYPVDAVLLDYRLPDLDGLEFLAQLQSSMHQPCLPIIMVTGQGNEAIAVQSMKVGAQDYLVKEQITPAGLHLAINGVIETVQLRLQLQQRIEREQLVAQITQKIHKTLDLEEILQTTVTEVRQFLQADRVFIYRFHPDFSGIVVVESVGDNCLPILNASVEDCYFVETRGEDYRQGRIQAVADIYTAGLDECHINLLTQFQIRANLVVPILYSRALWGLLVVNQCATPREWQPLEITLLQQLATQVGIALQQAELYQQAQNELAERRRIEVELRESEERFRQLAENTNAVFWITELPERRVSYVSPAYKRLWNLNPENIYRNYQTWINLLHPEDREAVENAFYEKAFASKFDEEYRIVLPDGTVRWVRDRCFPLQDELGKVYRLTGIAEDITDRKQAELERTHLLERERAARADAERANRVKDEFLAILSHELRSPLTPILAWAQLLQTRRLDAARTVEALDTIERYAKIQTQLIDDLLDIARILRGKLVLNIAPVNLAFVIEAAIDTVRAAADAKSITLHSVISAIEEVSGDAVRLQQIVWNLLSNAIKFTPAGGQVEVKLEKVEESVEAWESTRMGEQEIVFNSTHHPVAHYAQITVTDTGKGINPDFLPHIFESFQQEDASTTRKYGGLGLGLAIVHHLVEAHGGTVWANSKGEKQGATFTVRLPLLNPNSKQNRIEKLPEHTLDLTKIRILVVDDEADVREVLTVLLTEYGADVLALPSANEVLATLESFQPDVVISDIGMPEVDGYSLIQQIRALPPEQGGQIPAIALTAYAREEDRQRAIVSGYQQHMTKPLELEELVQTVMTLLGSKTTRTFSGS